VVVSTPPVSAQAAPTPSLPTPPVSAQAATAPSLPTLPTSAQATPVRSLPTTPMRRAQATSPKPLPTTPLRTQTTTPAPNSMTSSPADAKGVRLPLHPPITSTERAQPRVTSQAINTEHAEHHQQHLQFFEGEHHVAEVPKSIAKLPEDPKSRLIRLLQDTLLECTKLNEELGNTNGKVNPGLRKCQTDLAVMLRSVEQTVEIDTKKHDVVMGKIKELRGTVYHNRPRVNAKIDESKTDSETESGSDSEHPHIK